MQRIQLLIFIANYVCGTGSAHEIGNIVYTEDENEYVIRQELTKDQNRKVEELTTELHYWRNIIKDSFKDGI